ncbi:uncharacterized protein LOC117167557 [Belonocnema kinseyi]|uniref:uncharacterized protein LOC117167557 n=1 Tax=Belonocnema kinseyi TaxID=2817044 RepID=UPI00143E0A57|nr:uncharacterized protein LOC117167557 [Belonocnema kinseyi]
MELLMFLLLSSVIFSQDCKSQDPNTEHFLPIYPVYPYSPNFMKRGSERNVSTLRAQNSFLQKDVSRDSNASSFGQNFSRKQYNPNFFSKTPLPSQNLPFSAPYVPTSFGSTPFGASSFSQFTFRPNPIGTFPFNANPFYLNPYKTQNSFSSYQNSPLTQSPQQSLFPNVNPNLYQPPVSVPNFYNQYPPSVRPAGADERKRQNADKLKYKESDSEELKGSQFKDGANYLTRNIKDLDGQSASLGYPSTAYIKPYQLEQFMIQTLIKLLPQNVAQQVNQSSQRSQIQYPIYQTSSNIQNSPNHGTVTKDGQSYISVPNVIAKTASSYVVNPTVITKSIIQVSPGQAHQTQAIIGKNSRSPTFRGRAISGESEFSNIRVSRSETKKHL